MMMTSIKYPSLYTFSASVTNPTVLLPHSRDYSCYVSRPILAPPSLWVPKHTDLRAHDFAHSADLWHKPWLVVFFPLGDSPATEFSVPTFQNALFHTEQSVPKRRHGKFRRRGSPRRIQHSQHGESFKPRRA